MEHENKSVKKIKKFIYQWVNKQFLDGCSSYNSLEVRKSCRSKQQARKVFTVMQVPHAAGLTFFNPLRAVDFTREHGFPVVIKPNVSGFSRGSHFPINNYQELWKAICFAKAWWPVTVIESYLKGKNYRVVVANHGIMAVIERYAPFVIGDGLSTIEQLIHEENKIRDKMGLYPEMYPIEISKRTIRYLHKQNLNPDSIPQQNERIEIYNKIALAPGGTVETVEIETLHKENKEIFLHILEQFNANILGIDVIMEKGIDQSFKDQKCIFLEVNSRPYLKMHNKPRFGKTPDLSDHFAQLDKLIINDPDIF